MGHTGDLRRPRHPCTQLQVHWERLLFNVASCMYSYPANEYENFTRFMYYVLSIVLNNYQINSW